MRGQVLAELSKLRKRKRRKSGYKPVFDSHADWKTGHERLTEKLEQTVRHKMSRSGAPKKPRTIKTPQSPRGQRPETAYRPEEGGPVGFISQDSGWNTRGWVIPLAIILTLFLLGAFFSSIQVPAPVTKLEALKAVSQKPELEKELETAKKPDSIAQEIQTVGPITEKKQKTEVFYMGIKISR